MKDVKFERFNPSDPIQYVISENLERRHLSSQQKAAIAVQSDELYQLLAEQAKQAQIEAGRFDGKNPDGSPKLQVSEKIHEPENNLAPETAATIAVEMGDNVKPDPNERRTDHKVAKLHGTNRTYVAKAKKVQEHAPELAKKVKNKELDLNEAAKEAGRRKKELAGA